MAGRPGRAGQRAGRRVAAAGAVPQRYPTGARAVPKWLDAGFTQAAVLAAADRTVSVRNPSFDTLDGILSDFDAQGLHDAAAIEGDQTHALCREVLQALGLSRTTPTAGQLASYREWAAAGNSHERILLACEICKQHKTLRFSDVDATLSSWQAHKLRGVKSIRNFEKSGRNCAA